MRLRKRTLVSQPRLGFEQTPSTHLIGFEVESRPHLKRQCSHYHALLPFSTLSFFTVEPPLQRSCCISLLLSVEDAKVPHTPKVRYHVSLNFSAALRGYRLSHFPEVCFGSFSALEARALGATLLLHRLPAIGSGKILVGSFFTSRLCFGYIHLPPFYAECPPTTFGKKTPSQLLAQSLSSIASDNGTVANVPELSNPPNECRLLYQLTTSIILRRAG